MISECNKDHKPDYNQICCLHQLLILNEHASNQLMETRYSNILLKTLNHHFKKKTLYFENVKLELLKLFLEVVSKYSAQYYFGCKLDYAKMLIKIALSVCLNTIYKNHAEVIERKTAILLNLSSIYDLEKSYKKAIYFLNIALPYAYSEIDKAIIYNNLARIYLKIKDFNNCLNNLKNGFKMYKDDIESVKIFKINFLAPNGKD
jgi:hypothetical protein